MIKKKDIIKKLLGGWGRDYSKPAFNYVRPELCKTDEDKSSLQRSGLTYGCGCLWVTSKGVNKVSTDQSK